MEGRAENIGEEKVSQSVREKLLISDKLTAWK